MDAWEQRIIRWLQNPWFLAVLVSWFLTFSLVQFVKHSPAIAELPEAQRRFWTRAIASVAGTVIAYVMIPGDVFTAGWELLVAATIGFAQPWAYKVGTVVLYRLFPWLETALSAKPEKST